MQILRANQVTKTYGAKHRPVHALNDLSLTINKGQIVGVMGPSGCGKSTLLNILAGYDMPTEGEVEINGVAIHKYCDDEMATFRRRNVGFVFQDFKLLDSLTTKENIALPLILDKERVPVIEEKVAEIMQYLNITGIEDQYPNEVSGGQKQRVAIGRAMVSDPQIVLADEPTGNLDTKSARTIIELFSTINRDRKVTFLIVTHDPVTASYCDQVAFLKDGSIQDVITRQSDRASFLDVIVEYQKGFGGDRRDI